MAINLINSSTTTGNTVMTGISGSSAPALTVKQNGSLSNNFAFLVQSKNGGGDYLGSGGFYADSSDNMQLILSNSSGTISALVNSNGSSYFNGGDVGIGVTNPDKQLTFAQTNDDAIQIRRLTTSEGNNSAGSGISWTWNSSGTDTQTWAAIRCIMPGANNSNLTFSTRTTAGSFSERMRVSDKGNVGIGSTDPLAPLHVVTPAVSGVDLTNISRTANNLVRFTNPQYSTSATMGLLLRVFPDSDARQGAGLLMTGGSDNAASNLSLFVSKDDGSGNNISNSYSALHVTGNTGNVGIGRTSPSKRLDINLSTASGEGASIILRNTLAGSGAYNRIYFAPTASDPNTRSAIIEGQNTDGNNNMALIFKTSAGDDPTEKMRISQTGAIKFNTYGAGTLVTDASGNITVSSGGGAGGPYFPLAGSVYDGNTASWSNGVTGDLALVSTSGTKGIIIGDEDNGAGQLNVKFNSDNGKGTLINNGGNLELTAQNYGDAANILFIGNEIGNSNLTTYFQTVGDSQKVRFLDNIKLTIGNSDDLQIYHDGGNSTIQNSTGNLTIRNDANDKDIEFACDDGSGGVTPYFKLDGGQEKTLFSKNTEHQDNVKAQFGNSGDFNVFHDGTNSYLENDTGDLYIRNNFQDRDIILQSDDGGGGIATYIQIDGSTGSVELNHYGSTKLQTISTGTFTSGIAQIETAAQVKTASGACYSVISDEDTGLGEFDLSGGVSLVCNAKKCITAADGDVIFDNYTANAVATTGSLSALQSKQAPTEDTLASLCVDPDGNVVRGSQEGTWTFTAAQLNSLSTSTTAGPILIAAPGANKAIIVEETNWMVKYSGTGSMATTQAYEVRQPIWTNTSASISRLPSTKVNEIMNSAQGTPSNPSYGFYSRDVPDFNNDARTYNCNQPTRFNRLNTNGLPGNLISISIKLKYRLFDATTF